MSVKESIIAALEAAKGKEINGQLLADQLGVTRAAIWKAISALKNEGYPIVATRNKGYMLDKASDILSSQGIKQYMDKDMDDWLITVLPTVDSTNTYAKSILNNVGSSKAIITALEQTSGRGRSGHSFYSPKNTGIYMSIITKPTLSPPTLITAAAAVAVCLTCEEIANITPKIKWVNDIFLGNKKICGILTEGVINLETGEIDTVIIGIGINLTTTDFPNDIKKIAGSINTSGLYRNQMIGKISSKLNQLLSYQKENILPLYKERMLVIGKTVSYTLNGNQKTGKAIDINSNGNLLVETNSGIDILTAGEISLNKEFLQQ